MRRLATNRLRDLTATEYRRTCAVLAQLKHLLPAQLSHAMLSPNIGKGCSPELCLLSGTARARAPVLPVVRRVPERQRLRRPQAPHFRQREVAGEEPGHGLPIRQHLRCRKGSESGRGAGNGLDTGSSQVLLDISDVLSR